MDPVLDRFQVQVDCMSRCKIKNVPLTFEPSIVRKMTIIS